MSTKLIGDMAEQAVILQALKQCWGISVPVGDRLPYDLVFDVHGTLVKIQVKSAWFNQMCGNYVIDVRRTKTNRRIMKRSRYQKNDFDFAVVHLGKADVFYVVPIEVFVSYGSEISFVETDKRQRKPRSVNYREAWALISQWAAQKETSA